MEKIIKYHKLERIIQRIVTVGEISGLVGIALIVFLAVIVKEEIAKLSLAFIMLIILGILILYILLANIFKSKVSSIEELLVSETRKILAAYEVKDVCNVVVVENNEIYYKVKVESSYAMLMEIEPEFNELMFKLGKELADIGTLITTIAVN